MRVTPGRKLPVTEENIRNQIQHGSKRMPPYSHIKGETLKALIVYLKSL
ncbi:MAG: cytochrome c [Deltaproteobacteria bacterium]|nr:cytochrome c [Deltaproteobacteria bacterium]